MTNWHSIKMYLGFAVVFILGGLQLLSKQVPDSGTIQIIISVLLMIEHEFFGNSESEID